MDKRRKNRKSRPIAWGITLVAIALLIIGLFAWNRHETRDAEDAARGPAAAAVIGERQIAPRTWLDHRGAHAVVSLRSG